MTAGEIEKTLLNFADVAIRDHWPEENSRAFLLGENLFAIIHQNSAPLKIDLKIDANLAKLLREKYESIARAPHLDGRFWVEILATGQLGESDVRDLIRHSYEFAK